MVTLRSTQLLPHRRCTLARTTATSPAPKVTRLTKLASNQHLQRPARVDYPTRAGRFLHSTHPKEGVSTIQATFGLLQPYSPRNASNPGQLGVLNDLICMMYLSR